MRATPSVPSTPSMLLDKPGDDPQGHRVLVAERTAYGHGVLADGRQAGVEGGGGKIHVCVDLDNGQVGQGVAAQTVAGSFSPVARVTSMLPTRLPRCLSPRGCL